MGWVAYREKVAAHGEEGAHGKHDEERQEARGREHLAQRITFRSQLPAKGRIVHAQ